MLTTCSPILFVLLVIVLLIIHDLLSLCELGEEVVASPYTTLSTGRVGSYQLLTGFYGLVQSETQRIGQNVGASGTDKLK